jgi:hypothetical protein
MYDGTESGEPIVGHPRCVILSRGSVSGLHCVLAVLERLGMVGSTGLAADWAFDLCIRPATTWHGYPSYALRMEGVGEGVKTVVQDGRTSLSAAEMFHMMTQARQVIEAATGTRGSFYLSIGPTEAARGHRPMRAGTRRGQQ